MPTAMILSAGLGTRLQPLTHTKPKALVCYKGVSLLERAIACVSLAGFDRIVVNVHHFAHQVISFLQQPRFAHLTLHISDESTELLDTGGAIVNARQWLLADDAPFLVYNVDIISSLNLRTLYDSHIASSALLTLAVQHRAGNRQLLFDATMQLTGWVNNATGQLREARPTSLSEQIAFSGVYVASPSLFEQMHEAGSFSIIDVFLRLAASQSVRGFLHNEADWTDIGRPEHLPHLS